MSEPVENSAFKLETQSPDHSGSSPSVPQLHLSPNQRAWRRFKHNRPAMISAWFLIGVLVLVLAWPVTLKLASLAGPKGKSFATRYHPDTLSDESFASPTLEHWFGTDVHGRDLLSRILYGAQVSLLVGAVGACVSLVIGVLWGAVAGYLGGRWDNVLMRIVDILYSLPSIIFVIVLITTLEGRIKIWMDRFQSPELTNATRLL